MILLTLLLLPGILAAAIPLPPEGYQTTLFYSDFTSPTALTAPNSSWILDLGTSYPSGPPQWGTNEIQTYTNSTSNISIRNNTLIITPLPPNGTTTARTWTSARIRTHPRHDISCPASSRLRISANLRLGTDPAALQSGIWPAFWALGSAYRDVYTNWPSVGEIDILESPNGANATWHTVHCGTNPQGPCNEPDGIGSRASFPRDGKFHLVSVDVDRRATSWREEFISWAVDSEETFRITGARVGNLEAWTALAHESKFLLVNVAVGGAFPDALAGRRTPDSRTRGGAGAALEVEYVAVYLS